MNPSSRTPEGEENQCPICGHDVRVEPTRPPGDAPCPHCGHLLWFVPDSEEFASAAAQLYADRRFRRGVCDVDVSDQIISVRPGDHLEIRVADAQQKLDQGIGYLPGRTVVVVEKAAKH